MPPAKRQETTAHVHSPAIEDYLEQIHNLIEGKGYARVVDIAKNLEISQASVTNMIQRLDAEGYVIYERYRGVVMTDAGKKIGQEIARRHELPVCASHQVSHCPQRHCGNRERRVDAERARDDRAIEHDQTAFPFGP